MTERREWEYPDAEDGDLARVAARAEVDARDEQQRVGLVELRVLRVLPAVRLHVVVVLDPGRVARVPQLSPNGNQIAFFRSLTRAVFRSHCHCFLSVIAT